MIIPNFEKDPTCIHLTEELSFTLDQARQACHAIIHWEDVLNTNNPLVEVANNTDTDHNDDTNNDKKLQLAMDWLCLHLSDNEIIHGFRPNKNTAAAVSNHNKGNNALASLRGAGVGGNNGSSNNLKIKAVPHPSISVISKPIAEQAAEWAEERKIQERCLKLVRLGFQRQDAMKALDDEKNSKNRSDSINFNKKKHQDDSDNFNSIGIIDDPVLQVLLSRLQDTATNNGITSVDDGSSNGNNNNTIIQKEETRDERKQELIALQAIYDDRLLCFDNNNQTICDDDDDDDDENENENNNDCYRLKVQLDPIKPLTGVNTNLSRKKKNGSSRTDAYVDMKNQDHKYECDLHVFLRPGYPIFQPPLFFFVCHPSLPPTLTRKIQIALSEQANDLFPTFSNNSNNDTNEPNPIIFDMVSYIEESLPTMHYAFCLEQRRIEFEANQIRLLKQREIEMKKQEQAMDLLYGISTATATTTTTRTSSSGNLVAIGGSNVGEKPTIGRRQRQKMKAFEKAFDRPEQIEQEYKEFRRKQDARVKVAQEQSANVRTRYAEQAVIKRQKERIEEEAAHCYRSAMSRSFRLGKTKEEARADAELARIESYRSHGIIVQKEEGEDESGGNSKNTNNNINNDKKHDNNNDTDASKKSNDDSTNIGARSGKPTTASAQFMERLRGTASEAAAIKNKLEPTDDINNIDDTDTATNNTNNTNRGRLVKPTTHSANFMQRLREMYDKVAEEKKNKKNNDIGVECETNSDVHNKSNIINGKRSDNKLDGYHLDQLHHHENDDDDDGISSIVEKDIEKVRCPRPVAVPAGELIGVMKGKTFSMR